MGPYALSLMAACATLARRYQWGKSEPGTGEAETPRSPWQWVQGLAAEKAARPCEPRRVRRASYGFLVLGM